MTETYFATLYDMTTKEEVGGVVFIADADALSWQFTKMPKEKIIAVNIHEDENGSPGEELFSLEYPEGYLLTPLSEISDVDDLVYNKSWVFVLTEKRPYGAFLGEIEKYIEP